MADKLDEILGNIRDNPTYNTREEAKEQIKALMYELILSTTEAAQKGEEIAGYADVNTLIEKVKAL